MTVYQVSWRGVYGEREHELFSSLTGAELFAASINSAFILIRYLTPTMQHSLYCTSVEKVEVKDVPQRT